jgi:hypothetical protein
MRKAPAGTLARWRDESQPYLEMRIGINASSRNVRAQGGRQRDLGAVSQIDMEEGALLVDFEGRKVPGAVPTFAKLS